MSWEKRERGWKSKVPGKVPSRLLTKFRRHRQRYGMNESEALEDVIKRGLSLNLLQRGALEKKKTRGRTCDNDRTQSKETMEK